MWACVRNHVVLSEMWTAIKLPSAFRFSLSLDYETSQWDRHSRNEMITGQ